MKQIKTIIAAAFAIAAAASCSKNNIAPVQGETTPGMKKISFETEIDITKAALADDLSFVWQSDDKVAVFDGTQINEFSVAPSEGNKAVVYGEVVEGATEVTAVYPFSAASLDGTTLKVTIPASQVIPTGAKVAPEALVCQGTAAVGDKLTLSQNASLIKFSLSKAASAVKVIAKTSDAELVVSVSAAEGALAAGNYCATIAPASYENGLTVLAVCEDAVCGKESSKAASFEIAKGLNLGDVTSNQMFATSIVDLAGMKNFLKYAHYLPTGTAVSLGASIDFGKTEMTPAKRFQGVFDGNNNNIYNYTVTSDALNVGMFEMLDGATVKNVNFGTADGEAYDGYSVITATSADVTSGQTKVGTVAAQAKNKSAIENVTTFVNIVNTNSCNGRIAGFVGVTNDVSFKNCKNAGNITCDAVTPTGDFGAAGITSFATIVTMENVVNAGDVTVGKANCTTAFLLGGLTSKAYLGGSYKNCSSSGNVSLVNVSTGAYYVGGLFGTSQDDGGGYTFNACSCSGNITIDVNNGGWHYLGGCIARLVNSKSADAVVIKDCTYSGAITLTKSGKVRAGGICGYSKCSKTPISITGSTFSGSFQNNDSTNAVDRVFAGMLGFSDGFDYSIDNCTFSGTINTVDKGNNYFGGISGTSGYANTKVTNCKTTSGCSIRIGSTGKSVGLIAARGQNTMTLSGHRMAGTIAKADKEDIILNAENVEGWMVRGSAGAGTCVLSDNKYEE